MNSERKCSTPTKLKAESINEFGLTCKSTFIESTSDISTLKNIFTEYKYEIKFLLEKNRGLEYDIFIILFSNQLILLEKKYSPRKQINVSE